MQLELSLEFLKTTSQLSPFMFFLLSQFSSLCPLIFSTHLTSRYTFPSPLHFSWLLPSQIKELHEWGSSQFYSSPVLWAHFPFLICNHFIILFLCPQFLLTSPLHPPQIKIPFTPVPFVPLNLFLFCSTILTQRFPPVLQRSFHPSLFPSLCLFQ